MAYKQPISVLVLVYTPDLQVLLLNRADKPGFWQSVTGSLENNETPHEAAVRELREETGLDAADFLLEDWQLSHIYEIFPHWRHRYAPGVTENLEHIFGLQVPAPVPVTLSPREHIDYIWLDWQAAAKQVFSWTNAEALKALGMRYGFIL